MFFLAVLFLLFTPVPANAPVVATGCNVIAHPCAIKVPVREHEHRARVESHRDAAREFRRVIRRGSYAVWLRNHAA